MSSTSKHLPYQIISLVVVCTLLVGYQYTGATWNNPTDVPPNGNVSAPVNTGSTAQVKNGALSVDALAVFGDTLVTGTSTMNRVHATAYCDENGENCAASSAANDINSCKVCVACSDDGAWNGMVVCNGAADDGWSSSARNFCADSGRLAVKFVCGPDSYSDTTPNSAS